MLNRGWAPLSGVLVDRDKIHRPSHRGALRPDRRSRGARQPVGEQRRSAIVRSRPRCALTMRRRRASAASEAEAAARLRALGYVSGGAPTKARIPTPTIPNSSSTSIEAVHTTPSRRFGARRFDEAVRIYQGIVARRPGHGDRLPAPGVRRVAARAIPRARSDALQRAVKGGITQTAAASRSLGGYSRGRRARGDAIALLEPLARDRGSRRRKR